jgi:hypothetical protein
MPADSTSVFGYLATGGFAVVLAAIINAVQSRRKISAEATEIITKAASGVVERLQAEADRHVTAMRLKEANILALQERIRHLEAHEVQHDLDRRSWADERSEWHEYLQAHVAFDYMMIERLRATGAKDVPAPPPLYPPTRRVRGYTETSKPASSED